MHSEKHIIALSDFPRFRESVEEVKSMHGNVLEVEQLEPPVKPQAADGFVHVLLKGDQQHIQGLLCHDQHKQLIQQASPMLKRCPYCKRDFFVVASPIAEAAEELKPYYCPYDKIEAGRKATTAARWISLEHRYRRYNPRLNATVERGSPEEEA